MRIDKDLVQKAVDEAFAKIVSESKDYEDEELIYSDESDTESEEVTEGEDVGDTTSGAEVTEEESKEMEADIQDKVEEEIEEAIDENSDFNFLGLDINIKKLENGKFNVKIVKDDKEKVEVLDSVELLNILGLVEEFFNELVLEDEESVETEEEEEEEETFDTDKEDVLDDEEDEFTDEDEEELTESYHTSMAALRRKYGNRVEEVFEHGLLAKELALEMVKGNLTKDSVKELIETIREKDALIASKRKDLQQSSVKYLYAKKMENSLKKASTVLGSAIADLNKRVESKDISLQLAEKAVKKYKSIISAIVEAKDPEAVVAATNLVTKVQSVILANVNKSKIKPDMSKDGGSVRPKARNVLNRTGKNTNSTLLSGRRYDGIDEMSAEILRIAGIKD